jgi:hypothetical protein
MAVSITIVIEDTEYTASGGAEFAGPYAECEGAWIDECDPEPASDDVRGEIEDAIQDAAYEEYEARNSRRYDDSDDYGDYQDDYDSYCVGRGGDYWQDPESGEYRCG